MKFINRSSNYLKRIKKRWRKPRGIHNKLRKKKNQRGDLSQLVIELKNQKEVYILLD